MNKRIDLAYWVFENLDKSFEETNVDIEPEYGNRAGIRAPVQIAGLQRPIRSRFGRNRFGRGFECTSAHRHC